MKRRTDWGAAAARLGSLFPRSRLDPAVVAWADAASRRGRWMVGFSGGADSLALLLLLWAHWPERRRTMHALHFDHRLRGRAATADAAFCVEVGRALGIEVTVGRWRRPRSKKSPGEAEARAARLEFFAEHGKVLWLGHQQDDIAETMLMRLARGSGTSGLAAPRPVQRFADGRVHVRPLLTLKKSELTAALGVVGVTWREDATNAGGAYFRNRVRHDVIAPWIKAAQRDALAGAARSRALLEEDDVALGAWLDVLDVIGARRELRLEPLAGKPRALWRRALARWVGAQRVKIDVSSQAFEALLEAIQAGRRTRHSLGAELFGEMTARELRLVRRGKRRATFLRRSN